MSVEFKDNSKAFLSALETQKYKALKMVGIQAAGYAKELAPKDNGTLRDSIKSEVDGDIVSIGSNVEYAP